MFLGYPQAFGIFQAYYTAHFDLEGSTNSLATIGTSLTGIMYLMQPIIFTLLTRYPRMRRFCGPAGLCIAVLALVLSSFATSVWQLILTQGVLCAIGSGMLFAPTTLYLDEWFVTRKGMAYGVMWTGKNVAGVVMPFIMSALLDKYGPSTTLKAWAVSLSLMTAPLLFFLKPRVPLSAISSGRRSICWDFLNHSTFWVLQAGNIIQSFGYFLPSTYLATYASTIGLSTTAGTVLIAVFNCASIPGGMIIGSLGDHYSASTVVLISSVGSAIGVFIFWGLSGQLALLLIFAIVYGFFAGGFSSTWSGVLKEVKGGDERIETGVVLGLLLGGRGIGNTISGPISGALLEGGWGAGKNIGYDTVYGPIIVFTGVTSLLGGWGWIWKTGKQLV